MAEGRQQPHAADGSNEAEGSGQDIVRKDLDEQEERIVEAHETASAKLVHEIIRQRGIDELERPAAALIWSALGAGFVIGVSLYANALFEHEFAGAVFLPLLLALGYSSGFIVVIAGRMQLFTESTITAVLPLATTPCWTNLWRTLRLWGIVFFGNIVGTLAFALFIHFDIAHQPEIVAAMQKLSAHTMGIYLEAPFGKGIPAGFLLAVMVWATPNLEKQEFLLVVLITGLMSLGEVSHSIVGSAEMWVSILHGDISFTTGIFGFLIPAALGNLVGGALLFALLAHAQVAPEIEGEEGGYRYGEKTAKKDDGKDKNAVRTS
jgi:formate/nitrite transporter FocA (FNT family)